MLKWLTEYIEFLLIDPDKLAEILAVLTIFQCVTSIFVLVLILRISIMESQMKKRLDETIGEYNT